MAALAAHGWPSELQRNVKQRKHIFWGKDAMKGSRKNFKIFLVSKGVNEIRHFFYNSLSVSQKYKFTYWSQLIAFTPSKVSFQSEIKGGGNPVGVWGVGPP